MWGLALPDASGRRGRGVGAVSAEVSLRQRVTGLVPPRLFVQRANVVEVFEIEGPVGREVLHRLRLGP